MFRKSLLPLIVPILAWALWPSCPAVAAGWAQWRGPHRNGISDETGLLKSWPAKGPRVLWKTTIGTSYSGVAVAGGRAVTQEQDKAGQWVVAFHAVTGKPLWRTRTGPVFVQGSYCGPRATPVIDGPRIYACDAQGNIVCLDAATGKILWSVDAKARFQSELRYWGFCGSPLLAGNKLIVTLGKAKKSPQNAAIVALDKMTGAVIWKNLNETAGYSSPVLCTLNGKPTLLFFLGKALAAIKPEDGSVLWRYPWITYLEHNCADPVVRGNEIFLSSGYNAGCTLLQVRPGDTPTTPTKVYANKQVKSLFATPLLLGGSFYAFDEPNAFRCIELGTGKVMWSVSGFKRGTAIFADGLGYVLGEEGNLVLARLTPEKYEKISEVRGLLGMRSWVSPSIADKRLYVRDDTRLICLDIASTSTAAATPGQAATPTTGTLGATTKTLQIQPGAKPLPRATAPTTGTLSAPRGFVSPTTGTQPVRKPLPPPPATRPAVRPKIIRPAGK